MVARVRAALEVSERRACRALGLHRSGVRYKPSADADETALVKRMRELALANPRYGYRRIAALLRAEGRDVNVKRVLRLWRAEGLKVPRRQRKRRRLGSSEGGTQRRRASRRNEVWSYDFVFDQTADGRPLKVLPVVDEYTRECLAMVVGRSLTAADVVKTLARIVGERGVPAYLRSDNGPEFIAAAVKGWLGQLAGLPDADAAERPVTIALADGGVVVRAAGGGEFREVRLARSPSAGPPARFALDRRLLARALALGCLTVRAGAKAVSFERGNRTLVVAPLEASRVVTGRGRCGNAGAAATRIPPEPERSIPVRTPDAGGRRAPPHDPPDPDPPDPLAEAEALRVALADAALRAGRLVAALKGHRRERRAVARALGSLKSLQLGPAGGRP